MGMLQGTRLNGSHFLPRGMFNTANFRHFQYQVVGFLGCPSEGVFGDKMTGRERIHGKGKG
jgi:hypothetical protein